MGLVYPETVRKYASSRCGMAMANDVHDRQGRTSAVDSQRSKNLTPASSGVSHGEFSASEITRVSDGAQSPPSHDGLQAILPTGTTIGRYVVLEMVGKGGMGVVYGAYDPQLQRRIALKLLRVEQVDANGGSLSDSQQRLLREAQAMAKLSHPNVLSVFDAGIVAERVFIATEFVEGSTIREWLRERKRPLKAILEVFAAAGRGLAAAHARGIVHRDFKPHNVLIDASETVRVMDFGLARWVDSLEKSSENGIATTAETSTSSQPYQSAISEALTQVGMIVGTPGYMAPEQYLGERVGPAADQFAFCVSLYEALFGQRPFQGKTIKEIGLAVCRGKMVPPPGDRGVPTWLRRALARGLHPIAEKRWPSMDALLAELSRDRRRRWVRGSVLAAGLGLAVASGLAYGQHREQQAQLCSGASQRLQGVWDSQARAVVKQSFMATELSYAADMWKRVDAGLEEYANQWIGHHTAACEATRIRGEQSEQRLDLQMGCLADRRAELQVAARMFANADEDVVKNAVRIVHGMSAVDACARVRAGETREAIDPEARARLTALRAKLAKTRALYYAGKFPDSITLAQATLDQARKEGADQEAAEALLRIGTAQVAHGETQEGHATLLEALWAADASRADETGADARIQLAFVTGYYMRDIETGQSWARHAEAATIRIGGDGRRESKVLHCRATLELMQGHHEEALELWTASRKAVERALGVGHYETAGPINAMGVTLQALGRYDEAHQAIEEAVAIWREQLGPRYPDVGVGLSNMGNIAMAQGRYEEALALHQRALDILQAGLRPEHSHLAEANTYAAAVAIRLGDLDRARAHLERALARFGDPASDDNSALGAPLHQLGVLTLLEGDAERSRVLQERAIALLSRGFSPEHPAVGTARASLARALLALGRIDEARLTAEEAVAVLRSTVGSHHPDLAEGLMGLAAATLAAGHAEPALRHCREALAVRERALGSDHPDTQSARTCVEQSAQTANPSRQNLPDRDAPGDQP